MQSFSTDAQRLDYHHPSLTDQLNLGLRGLELDLYHDPQGGHYAQPLGLELLEKGGQQPRNYDPHGEMLTPGFKILHVPDVDFRSSQLTLIGALRELRRWSLAHPRHLPVVVTMNLNDGKSPVPGSRDSVPWDRAALDELDKVLIAELGRGRLLVPDDVRGDHPTLSGAIAAGGWPTLNQCRGKFLWVIDDAGSKRAEYLADHPSLAGRVLFTNSPPGADESAVLIMNDPHRQQQAIKRLVAEGYLVRTRADAETMEAREGDFSRFEAAQSSGAQIISTDYYLSDWRVNPSYQVRFAEGDCVRLNPVTAGDGATAAAAGYSE
jgi:hypothetical protein